MHILITKAEYDKYNMLSSMIFNKSNIVVEGNDGVLGEITAANFTQVVNSLATGTYSTSDGILIPIGMLQK